MHGLPRISAPFAILIFSALPFLALADVTPSPGCRLATAAEQQQMADRGLPRKFELCPGDLQVLGIGQSFEQWYARLRSQSPCNKNTCTLSCRTRNTGAQVCGPVSKKWNSISCHPNNNTAIFPSVAYGFAAHIELLRRYCSQQGRCTISSVVQRWAPAGHGNNNPPAYAAFVSRNAGIPANQVFDPNDIDLMGRLGLAMACMEAGALPYDVSELKQGLLMAAGGPKVAVPANIGQLIQESLNTPYSPASPLPGLTQFFGQNGPGASVAGAAATSPLPQPTVSSPPPLTPISANTQPLPLSPQQATPGASAQAVGMVLVQPSQVSHGDTALVAWVSVGVTDSSCSVKQGNTQIGTGGSGSKIVRAPSTNGDVIYTLACTTRSGAQLVQSATLHVQ